MITIINIFLTTAALGTGLRPITDSSCRPAADLSPRASVGEPKRVASRLTQSGQALRWITSNGDTLRMKLQVAKRGTYAILLSALHGPGTPSFSARIWDDPLTRNGETAFALDGDAAGLSTIRFDAVPLGPGHHILELTNLAAGEILLDCVDLQRIGRWAPRPADRPSGAAFLGIQMGAKAEDGVTIKRVIPGTSAAAAELERGDVILTIDGERADSSNRVVQVIRRHRPGDRLVLKIRRDDEVIEKSAVLGQRGGEQAVGVMKVLDVQPGQVIADIGCGSGWLSEAIAEAVGDGGLVYAVEIKEDPIRNLRHTASPNVLPVFSLPDDVSLPANSLDTAMLHDVASHVNRSARPQFYQTVARALKRSGRLVIFGPHGRARSMLDELREYGFIPIDELAALSDDALDLRLKAGIVFEYRSANDGAKIGPGRPN